MGLTGGDVLTTCVDFINTLAPCLVRAGWHGDIANLLSLLLGVVIVATVPLLTVILLIWIERKFAARIQDRIGPNRVGPYGLLQSLADALKMLTKEDITPTGADRVLFNLAPIISLPQGTRLVLRPGADWHIRRPGDPMPLLAGEEGDNEEG